MLCTAVGQTIWAWRFCSSIFQKMPQSIFSEEASHCKLLRNPHRIRLCFISNSCAFLRQLQFLLFFCPTAILSHIGSVTDSWKKHLIWDLNCWLSILSFPPGDSFRFSVNLENFLIGGCSFGATSNLTHRHIWSNSEGVSNHATPISVGFIDTWHWCGGCFDVHLNRREEENTHWIFSFRTESMCILHKPPLELLCRT